MLDNPLALIAANWMGVVALVAVVALLLSAPVRRGALTALRLLAYPLLLLAVVALVYDGTRTLAAGSGLVVTSLTEHWQAIAPANLEATKAFVMRRLGSAAWDPGMMSVLQLPAWLGLGGLALIFGYLGRRRRTVDVFAN
jgi:hypothetical protein